MHETINPQTNSVRSKQLSLTRIESYYDYEKALPKGGASYTDSSGEPNIIPTSIKYLQCNTTQKVMYEIKGAYYHMYVRFVAE